MTPRPLSERLPLKCQAMTKGDAWHKYACSRDGAMHPSGKVFCSIHTPEAAAKRREKADARYAEKRAVEAAGRDAARERLVAESPLVAKLRADVELLTQALRTIANLGNRPTTGAPFTSSAVNLLAEHARAALAKVENPS